MISVSSFNPINSWQDVKDCGQFVDGRSVVIEDGHGERYLNAPNVIIRTNALIYILLVPFFVSLATTGSAAKVVSFYNFWGSPLQGHSVQEKCIATAKDVARVALAPIALLGLELAAIWTLFRPRDGRKLLSNIISTLSTDEDSISQQDLVAALKLAKTLKADAPVDAPTRRLLCKFCPDLHRHSSGATWSQELVEQEISGCHLLARVVDTGAR